MPSTERGRKLTLAEQAKAEAAIADAPKDVWLVTHQPLHPEVHKRSAKAHLPNRVRGRNIDE